MIDLHSHVLFGIDDGPDTIAGSVELARAAQAAGTTTLLATPHVNWQHFNDSATIARLTDELNARLAEEEIALTVRTGSEIAMTRVLDIEPDELARLGFAGGRWLLVEPPFVSTVTGLDSLLATLQQQGYRVLLAHPERCPAFHRDREMLRSLTRAGVLSSVTAGSLVGRFGRTVRQVALELFREGLVHNVASDAHDHAQRPPGMAAELQQAGLSQLTDWLTRAVPEAILSDGEIPPRPLDDGQVAKLLGRQSSGRHWWQRASH